MNLSGLPTDVQRAARIDANGEVSWPDDYAASAIEALTEAGHRVLGLDVRFYFGDGTFYGSRGAAVRPIGYRRRLTHSTRSHIDELERARARRRAAGARHLRLAPSSDTPARWPTAVFA
jgi:hypothetical protein